MNPYLEQLLLPEKEAFLLRIHDVESYSARHHFHPELELHLVLEGWGTGFIGDRQYDFEAGDLVLTGPMLPHHWESGNHFRESGIRARCLFVQFPESFLGPGCLEFSAMEKVAALFRRSRQGLRFFGNTARIAGDMLSSLPGCLGLKRLTVFLQVLEILSESLEFESFLPEGFVPDSQSPGDERLRRVFAYLHRNLTNDIRLEEAASEASLSKSAFCRFFRKRTLRTFSDFVNELRVYHARRLIREKKIGVAQAALESGFNNLGYFHKTYKKVRGNSPGTDF